MHSHGKHIILQAISWTLAELSQASVKSPAKGVLSSAYVLLTVGSRTKQNGSRSVPIEKHASAMQGVTTGAPRPNHPELLVVMGK